MRALIAVTLAATALLSPALTRAQAPAGPDTAAAIQRGLAFLRTKGQAADGTFTARAGAGITALALTAALRNGAQLDDPMIVKGLKALEGFVKPDGGIYGRMPNYETCVAIMAFSAANADGRYQATIDNATKFIRGLQIGGPDSDTAKEKFTYGGVGYGGPERPDLSNTSYLIDALIASGAQADDEAIQRALIFVSRCQNLEGAGNDTPFAGKVKDGGFYYVVPTEAVDPSDDERYTENGGLRSYGSMSYAGFKSLVYAGLTEGDPRVKAVLDWVGKNYSVKENPGVGDAGLFYYYNSFASALAASKLAEVTDAEGAKHDWRKDLAAELISRQNADGSWTNANQQWLENDPNLSTSFALLALDYCTEEPAKP
jgi:hypothetical protein